LYSTKFFKQTQLLAFDGRCVQDISTIFTVTVMIHDYLWFHLHIIEFQTIIRTR